MAADRTSRLLGGTTKKHRIVEKRRRTRNIAFLLKAVKDGLGRGRAGPLGRSYDLVNGVGERTARSIEGRMRLPIGVLEREDFQDLFPREALTQLGLNADGEPFSMFEMACVRAKRLEFIVRLGLIGSTTKLRAQSVREYLRPSLDGKGLLKRGMPAGEARWLEKRLRLPRYYFDLTFPPPVYDQVIAAALGASMLDPRLGGPPQVIQSSLEGTRRHDANRAGWPRATAVAEKEA